MELKNLIHVPRRYPILNGWHSSLTLLNIQFPTKKKKRKIDHQNASWSSQRLLGHSFIQWRNTEEPVLWQKKKKKLQSQQNLRRAKRDGSSQNGC